MADDGWALTSFYHTVVNCADLDRSVAFYTLLGFEILNDRRNVVWPPFVASIFGLRTAQGRGVLMVLPSDPNGPMLDLLEWLEPRAAFPDPGRVDVTVPRIIAFRTRDVRAAYADLSAKGVHFARDVQAPEAALGVVGTVCCYDPDGTVIELIELQPGLRHSKANEALGKGA
jgi:catechol 2,3-dioxygenase-like lactoylglutathione lyase family enzyme